MLVEKNITAEIIDHFRASKLFDSKYVKRMAVRVKKDEFKIFGAISDVIEGHTEPS